MKMKLKVRYNYGFENIKLKQKIVIGVFDKVVSYINELRHVYLLLE